MNSRIPDFKKQAELRHNKLSVEQIDEILEYGKKWDFSEILSKKGALIFPHSNIEICGIQTASVVHSCLNSKPDKVLVLGVLHALTEELNDARKRVAYGGDPSKEKFWGIQGPGIEGREEWKNEFSLLNFLFLWKEELKRRKIHGPELIVRYPYLAGGRPDKMPGIEELKEVMTGNTIIIATADLFHHGIGYGDPTDASLYPEEGGLKLAEMTIRKGFEILSSGRYSEYNHFSVKSKSDARDVGQILRYLIGPFRAHIIDIVSDDMSEAYDRPAPTWVAGALVELIKV